MRIVATLIFGLGKGQLMKSLMTSIHATGLLALMAILSGLLAAPGELHAAAQAAPSFFNSKETPSKNLKPFKKWTQALQRYSKEVNEAKKGECKGTKINKCYYGQWMKYLAKLQGKDPLVIVKAINDRMNKAKYITDNNNWGQKDYWASPGEFMTRFGDCEDYAIIKFLSLKALGFKEDQLRVVAVKDLNLKVGHAILVVFLDGKTYVLDNQIKQVVEAKTIRHYQPVFSISFKTWWRHRI